ncbi:unnamed protein product [Owenia fusiformis]|uniref:Uncharacterized protein n=1 Tax=Owenia fusiformis TaxID=6347 RepID=A0A8J1THH9_OWEFU|nr:unnamed protein product [Owenia fusiformis]
MADINIGFFLSIAVCSMRFIECAPSQDLTCRELREYKKVLPDGTEACVPCSKCPRGQCFVNHCFEETDTACRKPRQNEYIERHVCTVCSGCEGRRAVLKNCTKHSDTRCGDCLEGYTWDSMLEECLPLTNEHKSAFRLSQFTSESHEAGIITTTTKMNDKSTTLILAGKADDQYVDGIIGHVWLLVGTSASIVAFISIIIVVVFVKRNHKRKLQDNVFTKSQDEFGQHELETNKVTEQLIVNTVDDETKSGVENRTICIDCVSNKDSNTFMYHPDSDAWTTNTKETYCQDSKQLEDARVNLKLI